MRPTEAVVDLTAITRNVRLLRAFVGPVTELCAVVKADGYGHGAVPVARAALLGGASRLAVALVEEAATLRAGGIDGPILTLSEPCPAAMRAVVELGLEPTVSSLSGVTALGAAAAGRDVRVGVHLKVDTGMHRAGCSPDDAVGVADAVVAAGLDLAGLFTHCAVADVVGDPFTEQQLDRFDSVVADIRSAGHEPGVVHAANSAAAIAHPRSRYDMVRCGIAIYGIDPMEGRGGLGLHPALELRSRVTRVHRLAPGDTVSYGRRWAAERATTVALVPIGYADGVRRDLGRRGGEVVIGGRLRPIRGVVTMDQLVVDCGDDPVSVGDDVVLIGRHGDVAIRAEEVADRLGTIGYEVVCAIGARVPRRYTGGSIAALID